MQTDRIDLYQMHHIDHKTPWDEIWQAMDQLVQAGKVLYVGSSNFAAWNIVQANENAAKRHSLGLVSEQSLYNLLVRSIELEMIPACLAYGVGIIPWSPLAGGLLAGVLHKESQGRRTQERALRQLEKHRDQIQAFEKLCGELNEEPANVALAWLLSQPAVTAPIIGPRTMEQLDGAQRALDLQLSTETVQKLNEIFPGPGGHAPEAYAW
jgi:aryl-alcohol dehydrogenase-like predicted oxidoreductase